MSRDVLLSLLRQGSTGSEILQILESVSGSISDSESIESAGGATLSEIPF